MAELRDPENIRNPGGEIYIDFENADWAKTTFDFYSTNAADFREELAGLGWTVDAFKTLPAYRLALASGDYDWLADL